MSAAKRARTTPTTSCKWGFISTGGIANDFALALKATPHAERYAVASRTQAAADEFKATHGFSKAYDSYEKLVADPEIDVIYIATPHAFHRDNILMCLDAGKNVVCEKPMVVNAKQAEECAAQCPTGHTCPTQGAGENLAWHGTTVDGALNESVQSWETPVQDWYDEVRDYDWQAHRSINGRCGPKQP